VRTGAALLALALALIPAMAGACATCLSSPYGDRTFNWAFLGLLLMPFAVAAVIGGVLALAHWRRPRADRWHHPIKETT
jgi:hypothetical protein